MLRVHLFTTTPLFAGSVRTLLTLFFVLFASGILGGLPLQSAGAQLTNDLSTWGTRLDELEKQMREEDTDEKAAAAIQKSANEVRARAANCVKTRETEIQQRTADLNLIGEDPIETEEVPKPETPADTPADSEGQAEMLQVQTDDLQEQADELYLQRLALENDITQSRIRIQECRFLILRADRIAKSASQLQQTLSAQRLSSQGGTLFQGLKNNLADPSLLVAMGIEKVVQDLNKAAPKRDRLLMLLGLVLFAGLMGQLAHRFLDKWGSEQRGRGGEPALLTVLARNISSLLPVVLVGFTAAVVLFIYSAPNPGGNILFRFAVAIILYGLSHIVIKWLIGPYSPGANFLSTPELPTLISHRLRVFAVVVIGGYVLFGSSAFSGAPERHLWALRSLFVFLLGTTLIWAIHAGREIPSMRGKLVPLRLILMLAALVAVAADFAGYRNLTNHLLSAVLATILAGLVLWTVLWLIRSLLDGLVNGTSKFSYQVRSWMGMRPAETRSELGWIRLIMNFALWIGFAAVLIAMWDPSGNLLPKISQQISQGIPISQSKTLVLKDILTGLLAFGVLLAITAWIKARLSTRWLRDMGMDRGSREAIVTLGGYVGFMTALIIGLVMAGVDFKGLAIVVGALSVGIGFGLQNIVANFVSGLILLFERPIKSGDYVSVGNVEGVIKQIRIRSTEIETQERQNVIVPNSELVSAQVTNWVLHDPFGRISVLVGVAYGSDTEKVKEILERVGAEHPEVLSKGPTPKPKALFTGFGDSSLDFELRLWIRHIEKRYHVSSDINFAIDKAFREAEIEIPFPQRDLHMRSWSPDNQTADDVVPSEEAQDDSATDAGDARNAGGGEDADKENADGSNDDKPRK